MFTFQTLDAIDGKQARRTNSSSPLGQLFDHGCDALSWTFQNLILVSLFRVGLSTNGILLMLTSWAPFYFTNLLEYYSGIYNYSVGAIDPTFGQFLVITFNLLSFFFGSNFYYTPLKDALFFLPEFITRDFLVIHIIMIIVVYIGVIYTALLIFYILKETKAFNDKLECSFIMTLHFSCYFFLYIFKSSLSFFKEKAAFVFIFVGFVFCILTTKLIVCRMS